jgi:DNA-binding beta-propeller fold protein YncE
MPRPRQRLPVLAAVAAVATALTGCSLFATPKPTPVHDSSLAPPGPVGYVVCPAAVTPVELATRTAEAEIPLPVSGTPALGNFAIATSPDGRWAYVVTSDGQVPGPTAGRTTVPAGTPHPPTTTRPPGGAGGTTPVPPAGVTVQNVVIPIDLVAQRAGRPIRIPGQGGTHAIVVIAGGRTVLAASGSTIVPVDPATRQVGTPLDLGAGRTIFGMATDPRSAMLYALVPGGVVPVDTANATAGAAIPTGLSVSSVYSPHGIVVTADGTTAYVVGQGGADFGGRVLPIATATGTTRTATGFDPFGISDPAAIAVTPDGGTLLVADSANNWINPVSVADFAHPVPPARLPQRVTPGSASNTGHPTDIVLGPAGTGAFVVDSFDSVVPYRPGTRTFGAAIPVCAGASSMAVAPAP